MTVAPVTARVTRPGRGAWFEAVDADGHRFRVRDAVPGERLRIVPRADDPGWAATLEVLAPSPARRDVPCAIADRCGGCHWLHLTEPEQRQLKGQAVAAALRSAGLEGLEVAVRRAPRSLAYRDRARLQAFVRADGGLDLGFHVSGGTDVVDAPECPLFAPDLDLAVTAIRHALAALAPVGLTGLEVVALPAAAGALVTLNPRDCPPEPWPELGQQLLEATRGVVIGVAVQLGRGDERPRVVGAETCVGRTPGGTPIAAAAGGFVQPSAAGAETLAAEVARLADVAAGDRILELHAGAGLLTWRLAAEGARVVAVESHGPSVDAARSLPPPPTGRFEVRHDDAARVLQALGDAPWDAVVADPPRRGLGPLASRLPASAERLVVAWCDVAGAARDVPVLLRTGWRPREVIAVDLFPQTRHVETLASFERAPVPARKA